MNIVKVIDANGKYGRVSRVKFNGIDGNYILKEFSKDDHLQLHAYYEFYSKLSIIDKVFFINIVEYNKKKNYILYEDSNSDILINLNLTKKDIIEICMQFVHLLDLQMSMKIIKLGITGHSLICRKNNGCQFEFYQGYKFNPKYVATLMNTERMAYFNDVDEPEDLKDYTTVIFFLFDYLCSSYELENYLDKKKKYKLLDMYDSFVIQSMKKNNIELYNNCLKILNDNKKSKLEKHQVNIHLYTLACILDKKYVCNLFGYKFENKLSSDILLYLYKNRHDAKKCILYLYKQL